MMYVIGDMGQWVEVLDTSHGLWGRPSSRCRAHVDGVGVVFGRCIYVVGGSEGTRWNPVDVVTQVEQQAEVEVLDPGLGFWVPLGRLRYGRRSHTATVVCGKICVVGGFNGAVGQEVALSSVEVIDPSSGVCSEASSLHVARSHHMVADVAGCLYVFGGLGQEEERGR